MPATALDLSKLSPDERNDIPVMVYPRISLLLASSSQDWQIRSRT
jgi:hypothetical protein